MVFYDLTSTYFEGRGPPEIGANGTTGGPPPFIQPVNSRDIVTKLGLSYKFL